MDNKFFTTTNALHYLMEAHHLKLAVTTLHKAEKEGQITALKTTSNVRIFSQYELDKFAKEKLFKLKQTSPPTAIAA